MNFVRSQACGVAGGRCRRVEGVVHEANAYTSRYMIGRKRHGDGEVAATRSDG